MGSRTLSICLDGRVIEVDEGDNLLTSLLSHGADVRYGCRAGVCGACRLYDSDHGHSILSCQTSVVADLSLSVQLPFVFSTFSLLHTETLSDEAVALTLLGPGDDSFGDRVNVGVSVAGGEAFIECMAVNVAAEPLTVVLQKALLSADAWSFVLALRTEDSLQVSSALGVRKGRLLYELGLDDTALVVVSTFENQVFEPYWQAALLDFSAHFLGQYHFVRHQTAEISLQDPSLGAFFERTQAEVEGAPLHVIYHGQNISEQSWSRVLRPLRIRVNQLHFVR
ncbi:2Fe-2S iron-sulfur cluster binding domain-containing protein [Marinomonas sp. TI.3.20]|uniref:2Fe-2S iron-sulfur cluster-binding protein n=1 Tax=Marinomonas sp. TI.3.20 TaxID=3121296 RepID=UPI00311DCDB1